MAALVTLVHVLVLDQHEVIVGDSCINDNSDVPIAHVI
jgi:hypothetical protein